MRRITMLCGVLAACLLVASMTYAISAGPTGRAYFAQRVTVGGVKNVQLGSIDLSAAWVGGTWVNHGNVVDNSDGNMAWSTHPQAGLTPEIEQAGGTGYGKIVMGLFYNNTPPGSNLVPGWYYSPNLVMDVVRISPTAVGMNAPVLLSDGRANPNDGTGHTEEGIAALPNPYLGGVVNTQFTGGAGRYVVSGMGGSGHEIYRIAADADADGDIADDAADYAVPTISNSGVWSEADFEIYKNRLYASTGYSWNFNGADAVVYYENNGGVYSTEKVFYKSAYGGPPVALPGFSISGAPKFAAGEIKDPVGGVSRNAVWVKTDSSAIYLLADYNGDGDAMDNAATIGRNYNEYQLMYDASFGENPGPIYDIELTKGADGTQFLLFNNGWGQLFILQLGDNGLFAGAAAVVTGLPTASSGYYFQNLEFDSQLNVAGIPEPATMLLLGTGALGIVGVLRRRLMK